MTKCNNCDNPAVYVFATAGASTQYFCEYDVPWSLQDRLSSNTLPKIIDEAIAIEAVAEAPVDEPTPGKVTTEEVDASSEAPVETTPSKKKKAADPAPADANADAPADTSSSDVTNN